MSQANENKSSIAIIGMAIRFPGDLANEQSLWSALREGKDLVSQIDSQRWETGRLQHPNPAEAGRSKTFSAGVLSRIDQFDAAFFGISPREAAWLDPQQRLLLELSWEAMENAGVVPSAMGGSDCAVFVGISGVDYGMRAMDDLSSMSTHSMTGNTLSIAANRLSYVFDFHGPSIAVDTACSSSLVALHQACNSLRNGEASSALVGGVNLLLHPYPFIGFTKASMLSPSGRCRAFDAGGNGYVRSEGGAVLMLKPLERAIADHDDIQAVILASGTNADGGRKTGLTIPSSEGQAELMRKVLDLSGISAQEVDYIEAHGTGTAIGDPIETKAIGEVYGKCRTQENPLPIGSVKTNLGHLEPASGMAGLAKAILILKNRAIPASLHMSVPNSSIDFSGLNLDVITCYRELDTEATGEEKKKLVIGVNSFGFGGANAHVLLQEFQAIASATEVTELATPPLFLTASTTQALREIAGLYSDLLTRDGCDYYSIAYSAVQKRERFQKRLAIGFTGTSEIVDQLAKFSKGSAASQVFIEDAPSDPGELAFIYSGNGSQWAGMGLQLMDELPRFSQLINELEAPIFAQSGISILDELRVEAAKSRLADTAVAQPLLFAMQVALTTLLRERGVEAQAFAGHSVGEVAAAWAADAIPLAQAIRIICARSKAQAMTRGTGRMAAVGSCASSVLELLHSENILEVEVAGINSPKDVTVSGPIAALSRLEAVLAQRNVFFRLLDLDYAFHSRAMDPIREEFLSILGTLSPHHSPRSNFISTVTGTVLESSLIDADYWWSNLRQPVKFLSAIETLKTQGCRVFIEIGPHAILQRYLKECLTASKVNASVLPIMRRDAAGVARVEETALRAHMLAKTPSLKSLFPAPGRHVRLPNYPWQRERHWHPRTNESNGLFEKKRVNPLLGWRLKDTATSWENVIDSHILPWLSDHIIAGATVFPGSAFIEMALAAGREHFPGDDQELEELDILSPIVFDRDHARSLRFELCGRDGTFQIHSRQRLSEDPWTLNAVGRLLGQPCAAPVSRVATSSTKFGDKNSFTVDGKNHYQLAESLGLEYGPAFQGLSFAVVKGRTLTAEMSLPQSVLDSNYDYVLHPAILDVCFQSLVDVFKDSIVSGVGIPFLPVKIGRMRRYSRNMPEQFRMLLKRTGTRSVLADFELFDNAGSLVVVLENCRFQAAAVQRRKPMTPSHWNIAPYLSPLASEQHGCELPATRELLQCLHVLQPDIDIYRATYVTDGRPLFEALSVALIRELFLDLHARRGDFFQLALTRPEMIGSQHQAFFLWMKDLLQQENILVLQPSGVWTLESAGVPPAQNIWRTLVRDFPSSLPDLVMLGSVAAYLRSLKWSDVKEPFPDADPRQIYSSDLFHNESQAYSSTRRAILHTLGAVVAEWPENRRLRILEISAGSHTVVEQLAIEYPNLPLNSVVAHADESALDRFASRTSELLGITGALLDGEGLDLIGEKCLPELYDVVIFQHTLHRKVHPGGTLSATRRKLARGGLLLVAERGRDISANFMFGQEPGWWRYATNGAVVSRLTAVENWESVLSEQGFVDVGVFRESDSESTVEGSYLLIAKRPDDDFISPPTSIAANWVLVGPSQAPCELASHLRAHLESLGHEVKLASVDHAAQALAGDATRPSHLVYLASPDETAASASPSSEHIEAVLGLVQALVKSQQQPRLWIVTTGGAMANDLPRLQPGDMQQAAVWGLGRVLMNEHPSLRCTLIDLDANPNDPDVVRRLQAELTFSDGEQEVFLGQQGRYVLRINRVSLHKRRDDEFPATRFRLDFQVPGQLRNLLWQPNPELVLGDGQVEVRVMAAGLNFRDVMYMMGLLPDEAVENGFAGATLGLEFSGVVTRVGGSPGEFAVGDSVMGFGSNCLSSHVVTPITAIAHKPAEWEFEAAATVPTVFLTAYYALKHLADLQPGERVLIHGAAGGVGIAAVQVALHLGAEIFVTVGSAEKREFVKLLGVDHVLDSRSLAFADDVLELSGGHGIDVILNSLSGEAIRRNLRILKPFGRFLELGKRDFFENTSIGLRPFKDNISYFAIDADQLLISRPNLAGRLFREVMALFRVGVLFPLPYRVYSADHVADAFRTMQQSRHIGKLVIKIDTARVAVERARIAPQKIQFKKNSTWLVTGGLSGLGLECARWLAERGAGHLVLCGRRGWQSPDAAANVESLEALGATVDVVACDVSNADEVQSMLQALHQGDLPLVGVVHAAMVLDDALLVNLEPTRLRAVLAPKVIGAWNLHNLTQGIPLEQFILFSSVTTVFGNPGQASYVAANAALESLAATRRATGLPVTCIALGPIGDVGVLARNQVIKDSLETRMGAQPLTSAAALGALEQMMLNGSDTTTVADFDWIKLSKALPASETRRFEFLWQQIAKTSHSDTDDQTLLSLISGKTDEEVHGLVRSFVISEVAQVLCIAAERINPSDSLHDLGMDSLMGVELALGLERRFALHLPAMMLSEGPTVERVTARIVERIVRNDPIDSDTVLTTVATMANQHGEMGANLEMAATVEQLRKRDLTKEGLLA